VPGGPPANDGSYVISNLPLRNYTLRIAAKAFALFENPHIEAHGGTRPQLSR